MIDKSAGERLFTRVAWASSLLLFVPLFVPLTTGRVFTLDDLSVLHLPLRHVYSGSLARGDSLTWTPLFFSGFYIHGEGQLGGFHPIHLLLYGLLPLRIAFAIEPILWYVVAFWGFWFFYRTRALHPAACVLGAATFTFSSSMLLRICQLNMVAVLAHLPWLLTAVDNMNSHSARKCTAGFAAFSVLVGSQALLGHPQSMWLCGLCLATYVFWTARPGAWRGWLRLGGATCLGLLIGAAQLLPTIDLIRDSARVMVSPEFRMSFSLHPLNLIQLVSPYFFSGRIVSIPGERFVHEFGVYGGFLATLMLVWTFLRYPLLARNPLTAFAATIGGLGILLALGTYGGLYELVGRLPLVEKFRGPARHLALLHAALSMFVAVGIDDVVRLFRERTKPRTSMRWLAVPAALALTAAGLSLAARGLPGTNVEPSVSGAFTFAGLAVVATVLLTDAVRGRIGALVLLPVLCALDLGLWGYSYVWSSPLRTIEEVAARADIPPTSASGDTLSNEVDDARRNLVILRDRKLLTPFVGLPPARMLPPSDRRAQRLFGVSWSKEPNGWSAVADPMPRVRIVTDAVASGNPVASLDRIDLARAALVPSAIELSAPQRRHTAALVSDVPGALQVDVVTEGRAILVTTESFHRGWSASSTAIAEPLETVRVFGDLLGVVVHAGEYRVTLRFEAWSTRIGLAVSAAGLALLPLAAAMVRRTR